MQFHYLSENVLHVPSDYFAVLSRPNTAVFMTYNFPISYVLYGRKTDVISRQGLSTYVDIILSSGIIGLINDLSSISTKTF